MPRPGEHHTGDLVTKVLAVLHPNTRQWVLDSIIFIGLSGQHGEHLPIKLLLRRYKKDRGGFINVQFVVFSETVMRLPLKEALYVVAHEIAHVWLKHDSGGSTNERAADDQAAKWGFPPTRQRVRQIDALIVRERKLR